MPEVTVGERGASGEAAGIEAAIAEGLRRAREAGRKDPTLRDAVWELLLEAGDTLGRLPNRERGWLTGASRAHWPAFASVLTRSEEHTSELQSLIRTSYAVFCLKKKKQ